MRKILLSLCMLAALSVAGCSESTAPKIPPPDEDDGKKEPPVNTSFVEEGAAPAYAVLTPTILV